MPKSMFSKNYQILMAHIADTRREKGLTQSQLADRLGKPQSYIAKIEVGERRLDLIEFIALSDAMEVPTVNFFKSLESKLARPIQI